MKNKNKSLEKIKRVITTLKPHRPWEFEGGTAHLPLPHSRVAFFQGGSGSLGTTEAKPLRDPLGSHVAPTWKHRMEDPPLVRWRAGSF